MDLPPPPPSFYMQHPFLSPTFEVTWQDLQAQYLEADILLALDRAQANIDRIVQQDPSTLSFESTFLALEQSTQELDEAWAKASHLSQVADSPQYREAYRKTLPLISNFYTQIPLNAELFAVLQKGAAASPGLAPLYERLKEETLYTFTSQGAHLSPADKEKLSALNAELAQCCQMFSENVLDATNSWELIIHNKEELKGLPPLQLKLAENDALAHGYEGPAYRLTLHAPSFGPVLQYVESESIRKTVWDALNQVGRQGPHDNTGLITKILALRQEKAQLLGKQNFADVILERRMAGSGKKAIAFIEDLHDKTLPFFNSQIAELGQVEPWSLGYAVEKLQQERLNFDSEVLRPYFPLPQVIDGIFYLAQKLFSIQIEAVPTRYTSLDTPPHASDSAQGQSAKAAVPVWSPDVSFYKITQAGKHLGSFYMDLYPRASKRSGAWANVLVPKRPLQPTDLTVEAIARHSQSSEAYPIALSPALGLICANFTPSAEANTPPLLSHDEVQTLFHEFGHLLHIMLGEVPIPSLNGIHVWWDFVELPSQILENWCWERESLDRFARHYQTQEGLADDLFEKLSASRSFFGALGMMRQLALARLDLALHTEVYSEDEREAKLQELLASYTPSCYKAPPPSIAPRFTHIFSDSTGYAAGYYSYKWAEVLDADAFNRFEKEGIFNSTTGAAFRDNILSKGNSLPPNVLFKNFTGHEPDPQALLKRYKLIPCHVKSP
jgi:oligopeptidase A